MFTGILLIGLAVLGFAVGALVLRADMGRLDNRMFALLAAADSARSAWLGGVVLDGHVLGSEATLVPGTVGSIIVGYFSIEFAYSFPFSRRAPRWLRWTALVMSLAAIVIVVNPATRPWCKSFLTWGYFVPIFAGTLWLLRANYHRLVGDGAGIPVIMAAVALRWVAGMFAYLVAFRIDHDFFQKSLFVENTVVVALGYLMMLYTLLRHQMFRVRGALAEVVLYSCCAFAIVGLTMLGVEGSLRYGGGPVAQRTLLVLVGLMPVALVFLALHVRSRLEQSILCPLDPRRAKRKVILEGVLDHPAAEPNDLIAVTRQALEEMTLGGRVSWHPSVPEPARAKLYVFRGAAVDAPAVAALDALDADLIVPAKHFGVLAVKDGLLDRDSVLTGITLAQHLALRLENHGLVGELQESRRLAALGSFAAAIAHDIRTPLTSIQMNVQILRGKARLPADDMEYFDIALEELKRLNDHVQELLDYAKPVKLTAGPVDVREVADDTARGMEPILADRRVNLEKSHQERLPSVVADAHRLRQILWNLLDNASRASHEGSAIVLRTRSENGRVAIEVEDAGRGIDAEHLPRIFDPFYTTRADGTGLGLAICQKLVKAHQGEIQVRSAPGKGSTFTILLPST
jgi:signal transduction histidine kinase